MISVIACMSSQSRINPSFFQALADPTRLAVFESLVANEQSVAGLTKRFQISQPAISQHLAVLRKAGLVSEERRGKFHYYKAEPSGLVPLFNWLKHYEKFWRKRLRKLRTLLEEIDD